MQEDLNKKIGRATKWSSITEIIAKLISPLVNILLARLLDPSAFGAVTTITMVISFAEVFTDAGFQKYLIQHEFSTTEELDRSTNVAFWTNLSFSAFVCVIIFAFRHGIANLVGSPNLGNAISIASISIILVAFSSIQMARYKRDLDFKTLFFVRMGTALIPVFVTVPLALIFRNFWALLIGTLASNLFSAVVLTAKSKWKPKLFYKFSVLKKMLSFSMWSLFESIAIWLTAYVDVFIVGYYLNDHYVGLYKTSMTTVNSYMAIITAAVVPVLFSALSRVQNDEKQYRSIYYSFQKITSLLIIPMGVGLFLFSDIVTYILLGSQWMEASTFIGLWGLMSAITIIYSQFNGEVYRSRGEPNVSLFAQIVHLVFLIPVIMISVRYGFESLYIARSVVRLQGVLVSFLIICIRYKFKFIDIIKNTLPAIICSLIMGAAGYVMKMLMDGILWQFVCIAVCIVVYFAALFMLFPKTRREILNYPIVRKFLKTKAKEVQVEDNQKHQG
ncbi:MAG: lipopolysaccharide biosynthesis protein [Clostridia bacterium]|nr:lipopolysaccharide biosynthesis protein [Clostridia bacterium]